MEPDKEDDKAFHGGKGTESKVQVYFTENTRWRENYQRNNKSKGQKNLRCFPHCCVGFGHQDGFCGQSITVILKYVDGAVDVSNLMACAEFARADKPAHANNSQITLGQINNHGVAEDTDRTSFIEGLRLLDRKTNPLTPRNTRSIKFEFNRNLKGWHYGFLGSKKTRNLFHVFRVYVLEKVVPQPAGATEDVYTVLSSCVSPHWQMYCRRRKGAIKQAEAKRRAAQLVDGPYRNIKQENIPMNGYAITPSVYGGGQFFNPQQPSFEDTDTKRYYRRKNSVDRLVVSGRGENKSLKRRPNTLDIPQPRIASRRRSDPSTDFSNMSLMANPQYQDRKQTPARCSSVPTNGSPLALSETSTDKRFELLLGLLKHVHLPDDPSERVSCLGQGRFSDFANRVKQFVTHWTLTVTSWPPSTREFAPKERYTKEENFARFIVTLETFNKSVQSFAKVNSDQEPPEKVASDALKILDACWKRYTRSMAARATNEKDDEEAVLLWSDSNKDASLLDIPAFSPRILQSPCAEGVFNFNYDEWSMIHGCLQPTPRGTLIPTVKSPAYSSNANCTQRPPKQPISPKNSFLSDFQALTPRVSAITPRNSASFGSLLSPTGFATGVNSEQMTNFLLE
eukprot:CAMPEP_0203784502 /NCGR_PEP_ID=MMETSP0100_2-20121128/499_1 /ASSEMBLY_ACC=CAM_ASM_000210 /TAXON_ID=96639 /ORGANISM=" , Strain NY0313808BC1" /LENGTH=623 /DNA_ID=CAMNT_0050686485 /DNA_START=300 /DNA_END=2168 /DNA_ORIENTATION=+